MKFLIWFVYLAIASILNSLLLSLVDTSASLQGVMLFSFFITVAVYGAAIFFAKTTCNWYAKKKNKCTPMQFVPSTRITQVPTSQEIVEVYRQPKNRVALSRPTSTILVLISCLICLLSIGFSAWSWWSAKSEYTIMAEEINEMCNQRIKTVGSANYDRGYTHGYNAAKEETASELAFYRENAVIVTENGEKFHCWGCYHLDGRRYLIYNVELAESLGYEPCADCWWSWVEWEE